MNYHCPKCHKNAVEAVDFPTSDGGYEDSMVCTSCLASWSLRTFEDYLDDLASAPTPDDDPEGAEDDTYERSRERSEWLSLVS